MIVYTNNLKKAIKTETSFLDCFCSTKLCCTEIACIVLSAQQLSGKDLAYGSTDFFSGASLSPSDSNKPNFGSTAIAFVETCGAWDMMHFLGRRTLIIAGIASMAAILLIIGAL